MKKVIYSNIECTESLGQVELTFNNDKVKINSHTSKNFNRVFSKSMGRQTLTTYSTKMWDKEVFFKLMTANS